VSSIVRRRSRRLLGSLALVVALGSACGAPDATSPVPGTGLRPEGTAALESQGRHAEPNIFQPGVISTEREEYHITFTPDGRTAYWSVGDEFFPISRQATIVYARRIAGEWTAPRVASFSGVYPDIDPFISPDGSKLYFSSIRPVRGQERADADIWVVSRKGSGWGEPRHLGADVNSRYDELYPSVDTDGVLYFGSDRPGGFGGWDIYRSRVVDGERRPARNLGAAINSGEWEFNPFITPDGRTLIFTGLNQPDGLGLGDLYASVRRNGEWLPRENLGDRVNSELDEYHPSLSPDGRVLFFVRHSYEPWVPGDIYYLAVRALPDWVE
jgi:Tol biopolymer transport system component